MLSLLFANKLLHLAGNTDAALANIVLERGT